MAQVLGVSVGDVVRLKSGGPWMTVSSIEPAAATGFREDPIRVRCVWFDAMDHRVLPQEAALAVVALDRRAPTRAEIMESARRIVDEDAPSTIGDSRLVANAYLDMVEGAEGSSVRDRVVGTVRG